MKKLIFTIFSFFLAINLQATDLTEGKQYIRLDTVRSLQPEIIEFSLFTVRTAALLRKNIRFHKKLKKNCLKEQNSNNITSIF